MLKIATLLTCHNRKEKTLNAMKTLYTALHNTSTEIKLDVYLTDDGSTDGTREEISKLYPEVIIIKGSGNLFWAKGMRKSWENAQKKEYDMYFLLNDDVELYPNVFEQILLTHSYSLKTFNKSGVYIGATEDKNNHKLTYSGSVILNKFLYTQERLTPNGNFQQCDIANANIMVVHNSVVEKIGILSGEYSHGVSDYDYSLRANKNNIPVLVVPEYCGHCEFDHKDIYEGFSEMSLKERKQLLYSQKGLAYKSYTKYMRKFFPLRYPLVVFFGIFKLYFPKTYLKYIRRN
ncbi:MAG: glycosyltransferase [Cellulophaga sp.]